MLSNYNKVLRNYINSKYANLAHLIYLVMKYSFLTLHINSWNNPRMRIIETLQINRKVSSYRDHASEISNLNMVLELNGCLCVSLYGVMTFINFRFAKANHHLFGVPLDRYATLNNLPLVSSRICFK